MVVLSDISPVLVTSTLLLRFSYQVLANTDAVLPAHHPLHVRHAQHARRVGVALNDLASQPASKRPKKKRQVCAARRDGAPDAPVLAIPPKPAQEKKSSPPAVKAPGVQQDSDNAPPPIPPQPPSQPQPKRPKPESPPKPKPAAPPATKDSKKEAAKDVPKAPGSNGQLWTKKGLGITGGKTGLYEGSVSWCYSWDATSGCSQGTSIEGFPMLWGDKQKDRFMQLFDDKSYRPRWCLGFNEPDNTSQANLSPGDAAWKWKQWMNDKPCRKVSPATMGGPKAIQWMRDFFNACGGGCQVDAVGIHWYGKDEKVFEEYVKEVHANFPQYPIWVTEYACHDYSGVDVDCSPEEISKFMKSSAAFLENANYVQAYSYFGTLMDNMLPPTFQNNRLLSYDGNSLPQLAKEFFHT